MSSWGSPYPTKNPPLPLPSTTSSTGQAGLSLKRRDVGQAVRGGEIGIGRKSVGQADMWADIEGSLPLMVSDETNSKQRLREGLRRRSECMSGQGRGGGGGLSEGGKQGDRGGYLWLGDSST